MDQDCTADIGVRNGEALLDGKAEHVGEGSRPQPRLELADGTGHGPRITRVVTGTDRPGRYAAAQMWGVAAVGHLAAMAADYAAAQPVEA